MSAVDEVKSRTDIVELIGQYVQLKPAGRNFRGLCPFHNERTPSFHVSPERQSWHCFGACGTGGDAISFVMRRENLEFREALRMLAERAGVPLGERRERVEDERDQRLFDANAAAGAFYHNALLHAQAAQGARDYLAQRGVDAAAIETFEVGYSPGGWEALREHLTERGFTPAELVAAGLLVESDRGGYDRFRNRLMFPIRDDRGRAVGFGARALAGDDGAKYINTPQTPAFDKGRLLYGLHLAKEAVRRDGEAIVVEGYMDVIAAHQAGRANVVASMGTALTERQIRLLERLRCRVLLALDADAAGVEATLRALQEAGAAGVVRAAPESAHPDALPEDAFADRVREWSRDALKRAAVNFFVVPLSGKDPDEMIRNDPAAWDAAVAAARPFTDHVFDIAAGRRNLEDPAQRADLLQELLPVVRLIEEPAHRAHYVQRLARLARVREDAVQGELGKRAPPRRAPAPAQVRTIMHDRGEEYALALLLRHPDLRAEGLELSPDVFASAEHRAVFLAWVQSPHVEDARALLPEELHARLDEILARDLPVFLTPQAREALQDCVARIGLRRLSQAKQASAAALSEPEVQRYMSVAVAEARSLQEGSDGREETGTPAGDAPALELAAAIVQDQQIGQLLHQRPARSPRNEAATASPQDEAGQ